MTTQTDLTPWEHTRRALHRAIDRTIAAWPHALTDANARGYSSQTGGNSTHGPDISDPTGNTACKPDRAVAWIAELADIILAYALPSTIRHNHATKPWHDAAERLINNWPTNTNQLINRTIRHSNIGALWWPTQPPSKGTTVNGVTIGERGNQTETCGLCNQPVTGGHADPIRRIDGQAFHGKSCWYTITRSRSA